MGLTVEEQATIWKTAQNALAALKEHPHDSVFEHIQLLPANTMAFAVEMGSVIVISIIFTYIIGRIKKLGALNWAILLFLTLSAWFHLLLEMAWVFFHDSLDKPTWWLWETQRQLWLEWGKSDVRWWHSDPTIYGLEVMAAFYCGPMALLNIYALISNAPWRHAVQPALVIGQMYGLMMTWIPAIYENLVHVPVNDPVLFYGSFIGFQLPWVIFPIIMVIQSVMVLKCKCGGKKKTKAE